MFNTVLCVKYQLTHFPSENRLTVHNVPFFVSASFAKYCCVVF